MTILDLADSKKVVFLADIAVEKFDAGDWTRIGFLTGCSHIIDGHNRLLRSLSWGDPDYAGNALEVLGDIVKGNPSNLQIIEDYIGDKFEDVGINISTSGGTGKTIRFTPSIFRVPDEPRDPKLVAVMMPFAGFDPVYQSIRGACADTHHFHAKRADDIWQDSTVMQDVFSLIFRSQVVVCDFTGRNPNVFYEAGIAHALGKTVVPITQSKEDVPSDLLHHRFLVYLNNGEGLASLRKRLAERLRSLDPFLNALG
jgi:hypothetical protein